VTEKPRVRGQRHPGCARQHAQNRRYNAT
jgi:hypothetical protein